MGTIINFLKDLRMEYKTFSPKWKSVTWVMFMVVVTSLALAVSGCSYGASKDFVNKMGERAEKHFPKYRILIENADNRQLEKMENLPVGMLDKVSEQKVLELKKSYYNAIDSWKFEIDKNKELVEGK